MPENTQVTNQKLGQIYRSFGITPADMDAKNWTGKVGACKVVHEEYQGEKKARIHYFINKDDQEDLPPWKEPGNKQTTAPATTSNMGTPTNVPW